MARFTSNQWAIVEVLDGVEVIRKNSDSQSLFRDYGICSHNGKLSTKQAVYKLNKLDGHDNRRALMSMKDGILYEFRHKRDIGKGQADYTIVEHTSGVIYDVVAVAFRTMSSGQTIPQTNINKQPKTQTMSNQSTSNASAQQQLVQAIQALSTGAVNEESVKAIVKEEIRKASMPKVIEMQITLPSGATKSVSGQHKEFSKLLKMMGAKISVLMVGDAGSGKTYGAMMAAKTLDLDYRIISFTPQTSLGKLVGFKNAMGEYTKGMVRDMYENGGVLILDELDACDESVLVGLNNLLEGSEYTFDDGVVKRHEDFRYVACTNTYGNGANKQYNGRRKLDASSVDRFGATIEWGYDEDLERRIFGDTDATRAVQAIRKNASNMGITITPRRTRGVNEMVSLGFSLKESVEMVILKGKAKDVVRGLLDGVSL